MIQKTEAIVLHATRYGDQRLIVDLFTRSHGRVTVGVTLSRSAKGKMRPHLFQPLTLLYIEADIRPQRQVQRLSGARLAVPLTSLLCDARKLAIALFVAEFLCHALRHGGPDEPLFDYVRSGIEWLDGSQDAFANFHLVFLMRLSRFLGFQPNLDSQGEYFDLRAATFCTTPPTHRDFLAPQEAARVRLLMRMDYATMRLFRLNRDERTRILQVTMLYYRLHLPQFPELRSLDVLHELFR